MVLREAHYTALIPCRATGKLMRPYTVRRLERPDAILVARLRHGDDGSPCGVSQAGSLLGLPSKYESYANLMPIFSNPALADVCPLKARVLSVRRLRPPRELTIGIISWPSPRHRDVADGQLLFFQHRALHTDQVRPASRVAAFELARNATDKFSLRQGQRLRDQRVVSRVSHCLATAECSDVELTPYLSITACDARSCASRRIRCDCPRKYRRDFCPIATRWLQRVARPGCPSVLIWAGRTSSAGARRFNSCSMPPPDIAGQAAKPARLHPQRRHDARPSSPPAPRWDLAGKGRGHCLVGLRGDRRHCRAGAKRLQRRKLRCVAERACRGLLQMNTTVQWSA